MFFNEAYAATLPLAATDIASRWDNLYWFLFWLSVFFFIGIVGAMLYFAYRFHHAKVRKTHYITGSHVIEATWIVIPTILLMIIFGWGWSVYHSMTQAPSDAYEVRVIAKQWLWQFQYDNGRTTIGDLYVPINRPVKMIMTSQDVIHSFFVPNFRVKQDVVPGMYTSVWFEARIPGKHQIFCAEYCGTSHSGMLGKVVVLTDKQWRAWQEGKKLEDIPDAGEAPALTSNGVADSITAQSASPTFSHLTLAQQGKSLFENKGCVACHSVDGSSKVGPSQKGLFGSRVELNDGQSVVADENYLRESIEQPTAKIVKGYNPVMPTFKGLLSETEMNALIAYIKSLK